VPKTLRIEIVVEEDDGRTIVKTLEGDDAAKWSEMIASVCMHAEIRGATLSTNSRLLCEGYR
jgi:hypothetical protein